MSQLSRTEWEALYGTTGTVFPDNTTGEISEGDMRTFGKNASDSIPFTRNDSYTWAFPKADTSGTNTYAVTLSPAITAYTNGMKIHVKIKTASTGASTLNANTVGARKIFLDPSTQADSGDLVDEQEYIMSYDSALDSAVGGWLIIGGGGSGGGAVDSVNGQTGVVQVNADDVPFTPAGNIAATDVQAAIEELDTEKFSITQARATRTVTGADALVQADDNSIIIFDSATDFDFTLDQLTTGSKVQFMNINTGVVTFINGSGVTVAPTAPTLMGAGSGVFPGAFVFYTSATTPIISSAYPESWLAYTSTITGFSVDPTGVVTRYTLIGKTCTVRVQMTPGTSNSTGMSMTLPFTSQGRNSYAIIIQSNGVTGAGRCDTAGASNVLTIYSTAAGGNFAATGNKGAFFVITYEIE